MLACGDDQVRLYRWDEAAPREVWRWSAATAKNLPAEYRTSLLSKIDDCKPVLEGRAILITASTGGVVLLDRVTGAIWFRAMAPMAHSATLLPGDRIAVALSIQKAGDRLQIYDRTNSEHALFHLPLPSGHGAVWDAARQRLFALSHDYIQAFSLVDWNTATPSLREEERWDLPGRRDGHDMSHDPVTGNYFVTTDDGVWRFDADAGTFAPFTPLNPALRVKSISPSLHDLAWTQAEENWWAFGFMIAKRDGSDPERVPVDGLHLYKVRWLQ
ncbi:MAG: hypothetical protein EP321_13115 [Sphingomonadales bacterium]|nr:MAG: hypothetical protein EP345_18135 [Sphingomonadales bacterium]TNF02650.1 MAG: hypothetical protein EP321_13115 [Sphingomonadales bacterium]